MGSTSSKRNRILAWISVLLAVVLGLAIVIAPVIIIFPFRAQSPGGLRLSYTLRDWAPLATVGISVLVIALSALLWRGSRWWGKAILVLAFILTLPPLWFSRQNHFEWMFNPLPNPAYARASESDFVANDDFVLAVELNGDAAAYPVRQMAYHHVVHDTVGGVPIVATY